MMLDELADTIRVEFPEQLFEASFEIVRRGYRRALDAPENRAIRFDLSNVAWIDPATMCMLAIWVLRVRHRTPLVWVRFPQNSRCLQFLIDFGFHQVLLDADVQLDGPVNARPRKYLNRAPYLPLFTFDNQRFVDVLQEMASPTRVETLLRDTSDHDLIATGAIRDVILGELGDNVFTHSEGTTRLLTLVRFSRTKTELQKWLNAIKAHVSEAEYSFFVNLRGGAYLVLVLMDDGIGIPASIKNAYKLDPAIRDRDDQPSDETLLNYAFAYHSSRRTTEERLGKLRDAIAADTPPPPTGLYRLWRTVRRFRGFLHVRSGRTAIAYDFLSNPTTPSAHKLSGYFSPFAGTAYKIYFPLDPLPPLQRVSIAFDQVRGHPEEFCYIALADIWHSASGDDHEPKALHLIAARLNELALRPHRRVVLIDCRDLTDASPKALHCLLIDISRRQHDLLTIVLVNVTVEVAAAGEFVAQHPDPLSLPVLGFGPLGNCQFLGGCEEQEELERAFREGGEWTGDTTIVAKYPHWFTETKSLATTLFSVPQIFGELRRLLKDGLNTAASNETPSVFDSSARVLLRSGHYCEGYFDPTRMVSDREFSSAAASWLRLQLLELEGRLTVVSVGDAARQLIDRALLPAAGRGWRHFNIPTPVTPFECLRVTVQLTADTEVVMVTDVIGTGQELKTVHDSLRRVRVKRVLSLVDAVPDSGRSIQFSHLRAAVSRNLHYSSDLPRGWRYSEVRRPDATTGALPKHLDSPNYRWANSGISQTESTETHKNELWDFLANDDAGVAIGHFKGRKSHLTYYVDLRTLSLQRRSILLDVMQARVADLIEIARLRTDREPPFVGLYYPDFYPGVRDLAEALKARLGVDRTVAIMDSANASPNPIPKGRRSVAVVLDDAVFSGETVLDLVDAAERDGYELILCFVVLQRGAPRQLMKLRKIAQYGRASVQLEIMADAHIPTFLAADCPVCKWSKRVEELVVSIPKNSALAISIRQLLDRIESQPIRNVLASPQEASPINRPDVGQVRVRWLLELSKNLLGPGNQLLRELKASPDDNELVLSVVHALALERESFLLDTVTRDDIFYGSLRSTLLSRVQHVVQTVELLTDRDVDALLAVLAALDERYFIDIYPVLLTKFSHSRDSFVWVLLHGFLSKKAATIPNTMIASLESIQEKATQVPESAAALAVDAIDFWSRRRDAPTDPVSFDAFRFLSGGALHDIRHRLRTLKAALLNVDRQGVERTWKAIYDELQAAAASLRTFTSSLHHSTATREVVDILGRLTIAVDDLGKTVARLLDGWGDPAVRSKWNADAVSIVDAIDSLVDGSSGLRASLDVFRTNLEIVTSKVLEQWRPDLQSAGVKVESAFPRGALVIYGEEVYIADMIGNVIENAIQWASPQQLAISAQAGEGETVVLDISNDGIPFDKSRPWGTGLMSVANWAESYSGQFEIVHLSKPWAKWATTARITLRQIPRPRRWSKTRS